MTKNDDEGAAVSLKVETVAGINAKMKAPGFFEIIIVYSLPVKLRRK